MGTGGRTGPGAAFIQGEIERDAQPVSGHLPQFRRQWAGGGDALGGFAQGDGDGLVERLQRREFSMRGKPGIAGRVPDGILRSMSDIDWQTHFRQVWDRAVTAWQAGRRMPGSMFDVADSAFLAGLGCSTQELFDFVDDSLRYGGDPDFATTLAVTAIRRDYFLGVMGGKPSGRTATMGSLPLKSAEVDGISWLPRLIVKARLKLRGEMPAELMYGCAGDRPFLRRMNLTLPKFLELVRDAGNDDRRIVNAVKQAAGLG